MYKADGVVCIEVSCSFVLSLENFGVICRCLLCLALEIPSGLLEYVCLMSLVERYILESWRLLVIAGVCIL